MKSSIKEKAGTIGIKDKLESKYNNIIHWKSFLNDIWGYEIALSQLIDIKPNDTCILW